MTGVSTDLQSACARYRIARDAYFRGPVSDRTEDLRRSWISSALQVAELSLDPSAGSLPHTPGASVDRDDAFALFRQMYTVALCLALVASLGAWLFPLLVS